MGTHPIFESDFDCLTDVFNNDIESITMAKKKKTKKKSSRTASWMPKFRAESLNEFYAFALIIIVFVTFYQFYSFSTEAYDMFVHPAFNWTCSNVDLIDNKFGSKCEEVRSYVPGDNVYEYDYDTFKEDFDYGSYAEVELVPIDESVQVQFEPRPNKTHYEIKHFVQNSFQKYLDEKHDGVSLKTKFQNLAKSNETEDEQAVQESTQEIILAPPPSVALETKKDEKPKISKFIIIGAMKCGTTAINNFLRFHPGAVPTGELYFFLKAYQQNKTQQELYEEYLNLMPVYQKDRIVYEKTPTYYRVPRVPERIRDMDPEMKIIMIVCDNSRRSLSLYFHLANMVNVVKNNVEKNQVKLDECGQTFEEFDTVIAKAADDLFEELTLLMKNTGASSFTDDAFIEDLFHRYVNRDEPFKLQARKFPKQILVDGLYAIYLKHWLTVFKRDKMLVIDGNDLYTSPAEIMLEVQKFVGLEAVIQPKHFVFNEDRGMFCLNLTPELNTCSKLAETKGRTIHRHLSETTSAKLEKLFKPFDGLLAEIADHKPFNWTYSMD